MSDSLRPVGVTGLLAAVPYLLGYQPSEALVVVVMQDTRVALTMCVSLADLVELHPVEKVQLALRQVNGDGIILVGFAHDLDAAFAEVLRGLALEIEAAQLTINPISVHEVVQVGAGRWRSLVGDELSEGRDYAEVRDDPLNAEAVLLGRAPASSRSEIAERVRPGRQKPEPGFASALREVLKSISSKDDDMIVSDISHLLDDYLAADGLPDPRTFGRLVALAGHPTSLRTLMDYITAQTADRWVQLWSAAALRTTGATAFIPLVLTGIAAWVRGDGVLTNVCADLASQIKPDHFGVRLLRRVTDQCMPPAFWESFRAGLQLVPTNAE